jgi:LacI family transcriptional regulator
MTDPDPAEPRPPTPAPGHPATLREVADRAQVHISTASRALDASQVGRISEATVARVRAAAAELRYAPDLVAAGLKRGRTATIGVVVADLANPYLGPLIRGISTVMEEQGIVPLIAETLEDEDRLERVLLGLVQRRVDAIITAATHLGDEPTLQQVSARGVPIVLAVRSLPGDGFATVVHDDVHGGGLAAAHLARLGHRTAAQLLGPADIDTFVRRSQGFAEGVRIEGLRDVSVGAHAASATLEEGRRLMAILLDGPDHPTAVFVPSDIMAVGAMEAMAERGLACPAHLSVVGYNDVPLGAHLSPPLTTIRLPSEELGRAAARLALRVIEDPAAHGPALRLPATFVQRASTGPPPR